MLVSAACNSSASTETDDFSQLAGNPPDTFSSQIQFLGALAPGVGRTFAYHHAPRYHALAFDGQAADVAFRIDSRDGSSVAWVLDSTFQVVMRSEELDPGSNHFAAHLRHAGHYYLVWRDAQLQDATFTVAMDGGAR